MRNGKAVKEIYTDNLNEEPIEIRFRWTNKNYEALPFLTKPTVLPEQCQLKQVPLQSFFYIEFEDGIPSLQQTFPKPYGAPNEYETIRAAKKSTKQDLFDKVNQKKEQIIVLNREIEEVQNYMNIINYLELEDD